VSIAPVRAARGALRAALARPALGLYLLALAALGFKWLSPISSLYERAGWADVLVAAAAAAFVVESARARSFPKPRAFHLALALYVVAAVVSAAFAGAKSTAGANVLLVVELVVLAVLTSELASDRRGRDAIVLVVAGLALATAPWPPSERCSFMPASTPR
jgi:asparagine N-glycosylation enzyme membrane subunit Stt3